jgi:hypothetical protein
MTLEQHVQRNGALSVEEMGEVARLMAEGLNAAHSKGILHRDVKPANVMLRCDNEPGGTGSEPGGLSPRTWEVKLIDFGLALSQKAIANAGTIQQARTNSAMSIAGTMEYAAPEQMGKLPGVKVGTPADIYGLAKTCCYALFETTEPTFQDWQRLPRGWAELLGDCLNKNPEKRPRSMAVVLERLKTLQATPVTAGPFAPVVPVHAAETFAGGLAESSAKPHAAVKLPPMLQSLQRQTAVLSPAPLQKDISEEVLKTLKTRTVSLASGAIYVHPNIPEKKLSNARTSCMIPASEQAMALIDCTVFGSASDSIVFGGSGLYYHHSGGNVPDPGHIPYSEFPEIHFATAWLNCVTLGNDRYCNKAGASIGRDKLIELLNAVKDLVGPPIPRAVPVVHSPLAERLLDILRPYSGVSGFYVSPTIPPKKVTNAMKGCCVPGDEKVLALIDCTVFGSASDALVFGSRGLYYHNIGGNVPDPGAVSYSEFPELTFDTAWVNCVTLGRDRYCNKSGANFSRDKLIDIFNAIRKAVTEEKG